MTRTRAFSPQTRVVLRALAGQASAWRYGYELGEEIGLKSGSLYPILIRLADRELLETSWEQGLTSGRPPRHLYRLTRLGLAIASEPEPVTLPAPGQVGRPQPARGGVA